MRQTYHQRVILAGMISLLLLVTGCTTKATIDATMDILSSTTPGAWFDQNGFLRPEYKVIAFTAYNQTNLEQDLARGQGEYLSSLGSLLGVADDRQADFQLKAQEAFGTLVVEDHDARVAQFRALAR